MKSREAVVLRILELAENQNITIELGETGQVENADEMYENVLDKIKKLTPDELSILNNLLQSYFDSIGSGKK